jgi:hypothetical protein
MSTLNVSQLKNASAASPAILLAADGSATAQLSSINGGPLAGMRNRIINGDMRIDARNNGAAVTPSGGDAQVTLDRWKARYTQASKYSVQQVSDAPAGFTNSLKVTSLSSYSVVASDYFAIEQMIEGFNTADLALGSASASSISLSFWVKSSLTGTFGGSITGATFTRSYPFTYSITSANIWEKKSITLSGDTAGTYITNNGVGLEIFFGLGVGASFTNTAGAWTNAGSVSATGATSVVGTNGATFFLTGVQLEPGTVATPFERRSYGQELALCQRYYHRSPSGPNISNAWGSMYASNAGRVWAKLPTTMRAAPSFTALGTAFDRIGSGGTFGTVTNVVVSRDAVTFDGNSLTAAGAFGQPFAFQDAFEVSAEL